jgi:hypothetical protein
MLYDKGNNPHKETTMKKQLAVAAIVLLALAGCGKTAAPTTAAPAAPAVTTTADTPAPVYTPPDVATESPSTDAVAHFGTAGYTWEDGLEVVVSAPIAFTPSSWAAGTGKGTALKFKITLTNKTGKTFDAAMFMASAQSGTEEANEIFDGDNGLNGSPSTKLLDGRTATFYVGFTVADKSDVVLQVQPGFSYDAAMFQS